MFIPGRGLSIGDSVTYNSLDNRGGPIGIGWHLGTDISVTERQDGTVLYLEGDGSSNVFTPNGSGGYTAPPGIYLTLQKLAPGNFKITDIKQNVYTFVNGKPSQFSDRDNNTTTFTYNANGRLYQVEDPSGRKLTYSYNTAGQVSAITDPANRTYQLTYQNSRLVNVTDPENKTALGRFLTKDSYNRVRKSNPQSLNQYAYCNNNPVLCFLRGAIENIVNSNKSV